MNEQIIPPSEQICQQIDESLDNDTEAQNQLAECTSSARRAVGGAGGVERGPTEWLGRAWYEYCRPGEL